MLAQHLKPERDQDSATRRRGVRAELVSPILDAHRFTLDDFVRREVFKCERSVAGADMLDDSLREITRIEN
jgi:hypothetical protein